MFNANEARKLTEQARYAQSKEAEIVLDAIKTAASAGKDKAYFVITDSAAAKRMEDLLIFLGFRLDVFPLPCGGETINIHW